MAKTGQVSAIIQGMLQYPGRENVQGQACAALTNLAANADNKVKVAAEGGIRYSPGMGCKKGLSPVQTGLPRELAKLLIRATQPSLVTPAVAIRLYGTIRRARHQSPGKVFAI